MKTWTVLLMIGKVQVRVQRCWGIHLLNLGLACLTSTDLNRLWFPIGAVWDLQCADFTAAFLKFFHTTPLGESVPAPLGNQSLTNCWKALGLSEKLPLGRAWMALDFSIDDSGWLENYWLELASLNVWFGCQGSRVIHSVILNARFFIGDKFHAK